ncbi:hypothetical protein ACWDOP_09075 [Nocardia sp. NPDC003693]
MVGVLAGVPLHSTVVAALRSAAIARMGDPVDTRTLLVEIMRADIAGDWSRICLHAGDIEAIADKLVTDPMAVGLWHWENVQLTGRCAMALDIAWRLAHRYALWPIPAGLVVLGLIADDSVGAARALRDGLSRPDLLDLVQSDVLGTTLSGIDYTLATVVGEARTAQPTRNPRGNPPLPDDRIRSPRSRAAGNWPVAESPGPQADQRTGTNRRGVFLAAAIALVVLLIFNAEKPEESERRPSRVTPTPAMTSWTPLPTFDWTPPRMPRYTITFRTQPRAGNGSGPPCTPCGQ